MKKYKINRTQFSDLLSTLPFRWKNTGVNFSRVNSLVRGKHCFPLTKFYTSHVFQEALFIPLKFYFKKRKLINGHVNWFIKINVNVEVFFFFTTTVSVTDQFWLISGRFNLSSAVNFPFWLPFPTQNHSTRLWYNKFDNFFEISVIWFLFRRKYNW